jgi:DNA-binding response OmpR family regulator
MTSEHEPHESHEPHTVLIVDDDEDCRVIYSTALEAAGFNVLLAADGEAGVLTAKAEHPDVVLMDVVMPRLNGCDAVRALRADRSTHGMPTLAITAAMHKHHRGELEAAGFDAVLLKPVEPRLVVTAVRLAISGGAQPKR